MELIGCPIFVSYMELKLGFILENLFALSNLFIADKVNF